MRRFFYNNSLSIVLLSLFLFSLGGQYITGFHEYNEEQKEHRQAPVGYVDYLTEGHFIEATFENWESEFLQMSTFIVLTIFLFQKGSSESKVPGTIERVDIIPDESLLSPDAPSPVRKGGWQLMLYQNSLSLTFLILFLISFFLHAYGGAREYNEQQLTHGGPQATTLEFLGTTRFWFQSFQNWQSEFLSIGLMVLLTVWLRQKGSPESKPVDSPHSETGPD